MCYVRGETKERVEREERRDKGETESPGLSVGKPKNYNMHRNFTRFLCINDAAFEAITETVLYRKSIRFRTVEGAATPALCHGKLHNDG